MTQKTAGWAVVIFGVFIIGIIVMATVEKTSGPITSNPLKKEIQIKHLKRGIKYLEEVRDAGHPHTVEEMQRKLIEIDRECGEELKRRGLK